MSGIGKKANEKVQGLIRKFYNPDEAGQKAGIEQLTKDGFLLYRLEQMGLIDPTELVKADGNYQKVTLPWLDIRKDNDHFQRFDAFKDMFDYYEGLERVLNIQRRIELSKRNAEIMDKNLEIRQRNAQRKQDKEYDHRPEAEIPPLTLEDIKHLVIDPELEEFRERLRGLLSWGSAILLGLSFENPDDNKVIVLNKPIIMETGKTRVIEKGGGQANLSDNINDPAD